MDTLGQRLRKVRLYLRYSQKRIADYLCVHQSRISRFEQDRSTPNPAQMQLLSQILERPIDVLLNGGGSRPPTNQIVDLVNKTPGLSPEDLEELNLFADFLRHRGDRQRKGNNPK